MFWKTEVPPGTLSDELLRTQGLDWKVRECALTGYDEERDAIISVPDQKGIYREDTGEFFAPVGMGYVPFQNHDGLNLLDALVAEGLIQYTTAGFFKGGRHVFISGKLPEAMRIGITDDLVDKYLLVSTSHDMSRKLRVLFTAFRTACENVLGMVLRTHTDGIAIRHTGDMMGRVEDARAILGIAQREFDLFQAKASILAEQHFDDDAMTTLMAKLVPSESGVAMTAKNEMRDLFHYGRGQDIAGVGGTAWEIGRAHV